MKDEPYTETNKNAVVLNHVDAMHTKPSETRSMRWDSVALLRGCLFIEVSQCTVHASRSTNPTFQEAWSENR